MPEEKKEAIVIPKAKQTFPEPVTEAPKLLSIFYFPLVFLLFIGLLILIAFLPISLALKIIALVFGVFILEDIHHSLKSICQRQRQ